MLVCFIFSGLILQAQQDGDLSVDFDFDNTTEVKEILVPIGTDVSKIMFQFSGKIKGGSLKVRILDPNGKKEGAFQLEAVSRDEAKEKSEQQEGEDKSYTYSIIGKSRSQARGSMRKQVSKPMPGQWKVEIDAYSVDGKLGANIQQITE